MSSSEFIFTTITGRPDLIDPMYAVQRTAWPTFMRQDPVAAQYWDTMLAKFPDYQFTLLDAAGEIAAIGNCVPFHWTESVVDLPQGGWDWVMARACTDHDAGRTPTMVSAIQVAIAIPYRGKGVSALAVQAMRQIAVQHGFDTLVAPVRPNVKALYPLTPIDQYIQWRRADGLPFDAWLRVHARLGAEIVTVCGRSMIISGTVTEWEQWTSLQFPDSGDYVIPGALTPVRIDRAQDIGVYTEPNVWMHHRLG